MAKKPAIIVRHWTSPATSIETGLETGSESHVQKAPHALGETSLRKIIAFHGRETSLMHTAMEAKAHYGDYSEAASYQEAMNITRKAEESFSALPSGIRYRFENDPQQFFDFMHDPKMRDKAVELGLLPPVDPPAGDKPAKPAPADPAPTPDPAPDAAASDADK